MITLCLSEIVLEIGHATQAKQCELLTIIIFRTKNSKTKQSYLNRPTLVVILAYFALRKRDQAGIDLHNIESCRRIAGRGVPLLCQIFFTYTCTCTLWPL